MDLGVQVLMVYIRIVLLMHKCRVTKAWSGYFLPSHRSLTPSECTSWGGAKLHMLSEACWEPDLPTLRQRTVHEQA